MSKRLVMSEKIVDDAAHQLEFLFADVGPTRQVQAAGGDVFGHRPSRQPARMKAHRVKRIEQRPRFDSGGAKVPPQAIALVFAARERRYHPIGMNGVRSLAVKF